MLLAFSLFLGASSTAGAVVLGSPNYLGGETGSGWGESQPSEVFNGGSPGGLVAEIEWSNWGEEVAYGRGRAPLAHPAGNYYPRSPMRLRAREIGQCPGEAELAYKILEFRVPPWPGGPLGPWLKWSGSLSICSYAEEDPRYDYPREPPGVCGYTGELGTTYGTPGHLSDIRSFRVGCRRARKLAVASPRLVPSDAASHCARHGCRKRFQGFRCQWHRLHPGEHNYDNYPVQRVECHRRHAHVTWWYYLSP